MHVAHLFKTTIIVPSSSFFSKEQKLKLASYRRFFHFHHLEKYRQEEVEDKYSTTPSMPAFPIALV